MRCEHLYCEVYTSCSISTHTQFVAVQLCSPFAPVRKKGLNLLNILSKRVFICITFNHKFQWVTVGALPVSPSSMRSVRLLHNGRAIL